TGKTAMKWIEEYTILNAKTLLRTTNLTVGQVSDELNFSSQSDFGKYFKRFTGISPKEFQLKR
ncbi:MAG: helix-turn-helix domain-containing protein, partial [Bacteroidales bacterium]|nr:helix-turn-helix domain-containing protein [Bacteroidales bacterium]